MAFKKQSVSLALEVVEQVERRVDAVRGGFSGTLSECLARYFEALRRARTELQAVFSGKELALLCDVLNGSLMQSYSVPLLYAEVEDSLPDGYAEKWEVDGPTLVERLRNLSYIQNAALVDAVERWWGLNDEERPAFEDILK